MATVYWNPNAANYAEIDTLTVAGTPAAGNVISATVNTKNVSYTLIGGDTAASAAAALQALLANTAVVPPEFNEVLWTVSGAVITGTSSVPGRPFTLTSSATGGGATITHAVATVNVSSSDVNNASNWLRAGVAALPTNGDDMIIADSSVPLLWNLSSLSAVLLNSLTRWQSFTGSIGLPEVNASGYQEYRSTYFKISSNVANLPVLLGQGTSGSGPSRERYDFGAVRFTATILNSGSPQDDYAVRILGTHVSNVVNVFNTSCAIALLPTEVSSLASATCERGTLDLGLGCTISGTVTYDNGKGLVNCAPASLIGQNNSSIISEGVGLTYASLTGKGNSRIGWRSDSTVTSLTLQTGSIFDKGGDTRGVVVTSSTIDGDTCLIVDPWNAITFTNATTINNNVPSGPFVLGTGRTIKVT